MKIKLLFFGIISDFVGENELFFSVKEQINVAQLKTVLTKKYAELSAIKYVVAINETYANDSSVLYENDVVALIPPVSGG